MDEPMLALMQDAFVQATPMPDFDAQLHAALSESDNGFDVDVGEEGPAVLRLRMLELRHGLRSLRMSEAARRDAERAMADICKAVLDRPHHSFADLVAKLQTFRETHPA